MVDLIKLCEFDSKSKFTLVYRASVDGFGAKVFHSKCDKIAKTLTIIKAKESGNIFGGYTEATWEQIGPKWHYKEDKNAFIFSLVNKHNQPIKMKTQNPSKSIEADIKWGVIFGCGFFGGRDIIISSNSNTNNDSHSNLGGVYLHPSFQNGSNEAKRFLAGSYFFSTDEIEVYKVE